MYSLAKFIPTKKVLFLTEVRLTLWMVTYVILSLFKLFLTKGQSLTVYPGSGYDDGLFLKLAESMATGRWLGVYDQFTLMKGIFYPLFMAGSHLLHLPLLFAQDLLYIIACVVTIAALSPIVRTSWQQITIFIFLLFNPVSFSIHQILREGIYPALTLFVVACAFGLWLRIDLAVHKLMPWTVGLGCSLAAFWLTREEAIWILPILVFLYLAGVMQYWRERKNWRKFFIIFSLPLLIWGASIAAVSSLNYMHYKIFSTVETKETNFVAAYGALSRVRHNNWHPITPVPTEARLQIYPYSSAFAELRSFLEGDMGKGWAIMGSVRDLLKVQYRQLIRNVFSDYFGISFPQKNVVTFLRGHYKNDREFANKLETFLGGKRLTSEALEIRESDSDIRGGMFIWVLREAVFSAGHYTDGEKASAFYRRLADEVNSACSSKKIDCLPERNTLRPPWHSDYLEPLLQSLVYGMRFLIALDGTNIYSSPSEGQPQQLEAAAQFTREKIFPAQYEIQGWAWHYAGPLSFDIFDSAGRSWVSEINIGLPSEDVYLHFLKQGIDVKQTRQARFKLSTSCIQGCVMVIQVGDKQLERISLSDLPTTINQGDFKLNIESFQLVQARPEEAKQNWRKLKVLETISHVYKLIFPWLFVATLIGYATFTLRLTKVRSVYRAWLMSGVLLSLISGRILILSFISVSSFPGINVQYLSPLYPLMILFMTITWTGFHGLFRKNRCTQHYNS